MMARPKCSCTPPMKGCANFLSGKCRLKPSPQDTCEMDARGYHYRCCPLLRSLDGKKAQPFEEKVSILKEKLRRFEEVFLTFCHIKSNETLVMSSFQSLKDEIDALGRVTKS